ncbi:MAG: cytochrome c biogenesis protein CcsA [Candidatus Omnitrophica bacterium]|nr:cytochrome c biogenesis protein CcsA [Candidatus Omnitrophota bacterium]
MNTENISLFTLVLSATFYFLAFIVHLLSFGGHQEKGHRKALALMKIGFVIATVYFVVEAAGEGAMLPVENVSQALAFFSWSLAFVYLVLLSGSQNESFGLILTPVLIILLIAAGLCFHVVPVKPLPALNPFFTVHIVAAFFAYACFTISFAAAVLYLIQQHELKSKHAGTFYHKLPSLESLDKLICHPMMWGSALLVLAVMIGFAWSKSAFDEYWILDPKTLATVAVSAVYAGILFLRYGSPVRTKHIALLSVVAFTLVLVSFIGMRFIQGSHNFVT